MSEKIKVLLSEEEVDSRIKQIAAKVSKDYAGKEIHLICVLKGGVFFTCELAKRITVPVSLDFMSVSSYGDDTKIKRCGKEIGQGSGSASDRQGRADRGGYHRLRKNSQLSDRNPQRT